ncbi:GNAT family N-acetyltransferase [Nisaea sediminum]|uniref:GNAT family N-acetyltransferase n=1 Tax=Nisaea sediminum TaxID=2775867 RepID=UPI0018669A21|nr:GNAT family N-acetyltransferase [Nisaea sediminum]
MSIMLRAARREDADALSALFLAARRHSMPYLPEQHSDAETRWWMENVVLATRKVTVADEADEVLGFSATHGEHLDHLYVDPAALGRGVGSLLLQKCKAECGSGLSLYVFQKNIRARDFYERHGFACAAYGDGSDNEENEPDAIYVLREALGQ